MTLDINRTKEILDLIHPYLRWAAIVIYALMFLYVNRIFVKDPILRAWLMQSLQETKNGGASGKSLSGFLLVQVIVFSSIVAIIYSPYHVLPEFMFIGILTFVGSLYGIKVASKYYDGKNNTTTTFTESNTNTSSTSSTSNSDTTSNQNKSTENTDNNNLEIKKDEVKKDTSSDTTSKNNPDDLG
jgi:hypothetical protein